MQSEIPWNVAGIPPEARDAARASARREGLSVGEWLTRRILRSLAEAEPAQEDWWTADAKPRRVAPESRAAAFDGPDMLARLARSEPETQDSHRRIEEQLKGLIRRLEQTERGQTDHGRALSQAATEVNIATREHAQAFDQLGTRVASLSERIARMERQAAEDSTKDAIKALHQGLSRLADQLAETANRSTQHAAQLATTIESVAGKLLESREEHERHSLALEARLAAAERALEEIETAHAIHDREQTALHRKTDELVQSFDDVKERVSANEAEHAGSLAHLEDRVSKLDAQMGDNPIGRRLEGIEHALTDMAGLIENSKRETSGLSDSLEAELRALSLRLESADRRNKDAIIELGELVKEAASKREAPPAAPPAAGSVSLPTFDLPPFSPAHESHVEANPESEPRPSEQTNIPDAGSEAFAAAAATEPAMKTGAESFLAAARRASQVVDQPEQPKRANFFSWASTPEPEETRGSRLIRGLLLAGLGILIITAGAASFVLSQNWFSPPPAAPTATHPRPAAPPPARLSPHVVPAPQAAAPAPQTATPQAAAPPQAVTPAQQAAAPPQSPAPVASNENAAPPAVPRPRIHHKHFTPEPARMAPPALAAATPPSQPAARTVSLSPQERLMSLANSGNAKAEELLGLAYLDGDGIQVNEAEGAKWLARAALKGEAFAAYRLAKLYEHGQGVAADQSKAAQWYMAAAKAGNRKAMHDLAVGYAQGTGVQKDVALAAQWFARAADLGLLESQFNLGVMYERGMGVPQSLVNAYKWYAIAAAQGDAESKARIEAIASQIDASDKAAADKKAANFRAEPLDPAANSPPDTASVTGG